MGSNYVHPMAQQIFWELSHYLFRNGSRPISYLSASKGRSKFCVTILYLDLVLFQATFKQLSSTAVLPFNEPVEAMDFDSGKCKMALTSHTSKIKLFHVEKNGTKKITLWIITMILTLFRNFNMYVDQKLEWHKRGKMCYSMFCMFYLERRKHCNFRSWVWNAVSKMLITNASIINIALLEYWRML